MKKPRVALATEFLNQYGGAQKTLEAIIELFPDAPIFTAKYNSSKQSDLINKKQIIYPNSKLVNYMSKHFFVFAMAPIFEGFDFSNYDLIISDGTTWNKGIISKPDQCHITYIHTPPRFLYGYSHEGTKWEKGALRKFIYSYMLNILRLWDYSAAQRPDYIATNSLETQKRISKFYRRDAQVVYPPVEVNYPTKTQDKIEKAFLIAGRLAAYKNFDLVIKAFNELGLQLNVIGTGNEEESLKKMAGPTIKFLGHVNEDTKHWYMENCLGFINSVDDEDFGIVPVETMAHGKPVLAHRSGGHLETIIEGKTGMYFEDLTLESFKRALVTFKKNIEENVYDSQFIKESVQKYSKDRFKKEFYDYVMQKWNEFESHK